MFKCLASASGGQGEFSPVKGLSTGACEEGRGRVQPVSGDTWRTCDKGGAGGQRGVPRGPGGTLGTAPWRVVAFGARQALTPT